MGDAWSSGRRWARGGWRKGVRAGLATQSGGRADRPAIRRVELKGEERVRVALVNDVVGHK